MFHNRKKLFPNSTSQSLIHFFIQQKLQTPLPQECEADNQLAFLVLGEGVRLKSRLQTGMNTGYRVPATIRDYLSLLKRSIAGPAMALAKRQTWEGSGGALGQHLAVPPLPKLAQSREVRTTMSWRFDAVGPWLVARLSPATKSCLSTDANVSNSIPLVYINKNNLGNTIWKKNHLQQHLKGSNQILFWEKERKRRWRWQVEGRENWEDFVEEKFKILK